MRDGIGDPLEGNDELSVALAASTPSQAFGGGFAVHHVVIITFAEDGVAGGGSSGIEEVDPGAVIGNCDATGFQLRRHKVPLWTVMDGLAGATFADQRNIIGERSPMS